MASPPILDFETLLAPLPGANPTGEPLPFPVRKKLDDARKEIDPNQFAANDPRRPEAAQPADWPGIEQLAKDTLAKTSKDLLVAARLTEALVKQYGFAGLRDGLRLLRRLTQDCWDRIHPVIQDGDLEARAGPFEWLDDDLKGARFPYTLRTAPLTKVGDEQKFGWQQWKDAQGAKGPVTAQAFDQAVTATPRDYCQNVVEDIAASAEELNLLSQALSSKMGETAPGLAQLRKALLDCQELSQQILKRKGPAPAPAPTPAAKPDASAAAAPPAASAAAPAPRPLTRDDVLARLADASALLLQLEPQSPVAYLMQRAVRLARLPLPDLMKVLIRDPNILSQLDRDLDLGLEKPDAAKAPPAKK
jgi:type VI secretion system protein ImpA